jgi:hypothetical protein
MGGSSTEGSNCLAPGVCGQPGVYGSLGTPAAGNIPGARWAANSWTDSSGNFWLFGGAGFDSSGGYGSLHDLWKFNPAANEWAWMGGSSTVLSQAGVYGSLGTPAPGNIPGGRDSAAGWTDGSGNLWLFGGNGVDSTGAAGCLNDLWEYQPAPAAPIARVAPTSVTFGTQDVGTTSASQPVTLRNTGTGTLTITSIGTSGDFSQTNNCGGSVATSSSCTINVTFTPTAKGIRKGAASISDNAASSPQVVALTGVGTVVKLSPVTLHFGRQRAGTTSSPQMVTLTNIANTGLKISGISITATGEAEGASLGPNVKRRPPAAEFAESNNCGTSVAPGESCAIHVTFTPRSSGPAKGLLAVSDDGGGSPQGVSLLGVGW